MPTNWMCANHGRRLTEEWGDNPPKISGGGWPMHPFPQYFKKYCYWMWGKVPTD